MRSAACTSVTRRCYCYKYDDGKDGHHHWWRKRRSSSSIALGFADSVGLELNARNLLFSKIIAFRDAPLSSKHGGKQIVPFTFVTCAKDENEYFMFPRWLRNTQRNPGHGWRKVNGQIPIYFPWQKWKECCLQTKGRKDFVRSCSNKKQVLQ